MYCNKCGKIIPENSVYCPFCGKQQGLVRETSISPFIETFMKKWKFQSYCFIVWFLFNTLLHLLIGGKPSHDGIFNDHFCYGINSYLVCTFLAPFLLILARVAVRYLLFSKGYNLLVVEVLSLFVGFLPVFFIIYPFIFLITENDSDGAPFNLLLTLIVVEFFFWDIFKQKRQEKIEE